MATFVLPDYSSLISDVEDVANLLAKGTIANPDLNSELKVVEAANLLEEVLTNFVEYDAVETFFDEVAKLYKDSMLVDIK